MELLIIYVDNFDEDDAGAARLTNMSMSLQT
jgi:hypothetical protein